MDSSKLDPKDCYDVILTDTQLHTQKIRKPNSLGRQYVKALHGSKIKRVYSNSINFDKKGNPTFSLDLGMKYFYDLARKQGKKYIRFLTYKNGMPVGLGKDAVEKLQADYKKYFKK